MKKKVMVTAVSSMFVLGSLSACGDTPENGTNNPDVENEPRIDENAEMNDGLEEPVGDVENNDTDL